MPLILGTVLFGTLCVVLANLAVDIIQVVVDPMILDLDRRPWSVWAVMLAQAGRIDEASR